MTTLVTVMSFIKPYPTATTPLLTSRKPEALLPTMLQAAKHTTAKFQFLAFKSTEKAATLEIEYVDLKEKSMFHRIVVHNLTPLNVITIHDSQESPLVYLYAEQYLAQSIYSGLDLFVGYNHHTLAEGLRDYMTFNTPLRTMHLTVLPQG
ncbi:hypothetical protein AN958_06257 [Leucoagaricus sp. SymC.cos]|nr:hypothetical protein AN958_06257 [Leucoagaricus sp. SymC.cos]